MSNMKRGLMFTAYELIICVTQREQKVNLIYQEKNRRPFYPRSHGDQAGFTVQNPTRRNFLYFQSEHKCH